jgi:hypothetical protein
MLKDKSATKVNANKPCALHTPDPQCAGLTHLANHQVSANNTNWASCDSLLLEHYTWVSVISWVEGSVPSDNAIEDNQGTGDRVGQGRRGLCLSDLSHSQDRGSGSYSGVNREQGG